MYNKNSASSTTAEKILLITFHHIYNDKWIGYNPDKSVGQNKKLNQTK